jgi:Ketopantoate reductase PanE/ApbA
VAAAHQAVSPKDLLREQTPQAVREPARENGSPRLPLRPVDARDAQLKTTITRGRGRHNATGNPGSGWVGGLVGALLLAQSGETVRLVVRPGSVEYYPHELSLKSRSGTFSARVSVASTLTQPADVLWITVKATDLLPALEGVSSSAEVGVVIPLLNGIDHIAILCERFGYNKVVPATVAVETERVAPGQIVWRSPFARLSVSSAGRKILSTTVEKLAASGFECRFIDDENTLMWSKLIFLVPFALTVAPQPRVLPSDKSFLTRRTVSNSESWFSRLAPSPWQAARTFMRMKSWICSKRYPPRCAVLCRRMSSKAIYRSLTPSLDQSCAAENISGSRFQQRSDLCSKSNGWNGRRLPRSNPRSLAGRKLPHPWESLENLGYGSRMSKTSRA